MGNGLPRTQRSQVGISDILFGDLWSLPAGAFGVVFVFFSVCGTMLMVCVRAGGSSSMSSQGGSQQIRRVGMVCLALNVFSIGVLLKRYVVFVFFRAMMGTA